MQSLNVYKRVTQHYADGYSSLDNWVFQGHVRLTPPVVVLEGKRYDEGDTYVQYVRIPAGATAKELGRALRDTMGGTSCRHEYDCCGCALRRVSTKRVGRQLQVRTSVSYNY